MSLVDEDDGRPERRGPYLQAALSSAPVFISAIAELQRGVPSKGTEYVAGINAVDHFRRRDTLVMVRPRPMLASETHQGYFNLFLQHNEAKVARVCQPRFTVFGAPNIAEQRFVVDVAADADITNDAVYDAACSAHVPLAISGGIGTIMAFGQTGSGKTYTMASITHRIGVDLFSAAPSSVVVSYMEINGKVCSDLLGEGEGAVVVVREDIDGDVGISGLSDHVVRSLEDWDALLATGASRRRQATTYKNAASSRAHTVCRVKIGANGDDNAEGVLYLIDLAGSERAQDSTFHSQERTEEMKLINTSLMTLKDCIRARGQKSSKSLIPFRRSPLTLLLKDVFASDSKRANKTTMIMAVSPSVADYSHTVSTLRYAASMTMPSRRVRPK